MIADVIAQPQKVLNFVRKLRIARDLYGRPYRYMLALFFALSRRQKFTPREIFYQDLLDFESEHEARQCTISKSALVALQQRLNPAEASAMTENKDLFYRYCRGCGLPTPQLFAVLGHDVGWTADGAILHQDAQWVDFLNGLTAREIVIKPSLGVYGRGILFLRRESEGWRDEAGQSLEDILRALRNGSDFDSFVVQERTRNHPEIVALSGTDYLQTLRINTGVTEGGSVQVLGGRLKVIGGNATTDNFDYGRSGNMMAHIDPTTGRIAYVVIGRPNGVGLEAVERHPATGAVLPGFEIPLWQEACALVRRAAVEFLPLRTVGWDVAITPDGPLLIEGNAWWDPTTDRNATRAFRAYANSVLN